MLTNSEKRAAKLAVSRYGADHAQVQRAFQAVLRAQASGERADLLERLVIEKLLTPSQAQELRQALDSTHFDLKQPEPMQRTGNGAKSGRHNKPSSAPTVASAPGSAEDRKEDGASYEPRALGSYRILRKLGEGGMGTVYLAYHERDDQKCAIKILAEGLAGNQDYVDRFYREAKSGALLNHPNIVRTIAAGPDRATGKHYLVMEYVDGPSAHELLDRFGRLAVGDAVHLILDIARALEHAHSRNVVHRDIKPDNILMTRSGVAKLADLGLAKRTDEASHLTAARQGFGTPYYMPYEQAINAKYADGRSDIYALGATLYHLVTGEVPFSGLNHMEIVEKKNIGDFPPASTVNPAVPWILDKVLEKMLGREPQDRYQTASELIVDLERAGLAATVPSFIDPDLAMKDPVVRERLNSPAEPTCLDVRAQEAQRTTNDARPGTNVWFLRYRDSNGQWCKTKATTDQVLRRLREKRLPRDVEACHEVQGDFQPLARFPEFQNTPVAQPAAAGAWVPRQENGGSRRSQSQPVLQGGVRESPLWWLLVGGGLALSILTLVALVLLKVLHPA